ncbi:MAG: DUF5666 domain-containing protein [Candidatus Sulfotelmatobacter sp.]
MGFEITWRFFSCAFASSVVAASILGAAHGQVVASRSVVSPATATVTPSSIAPVITTDNAEIELDPASLLPDLPALPPVKASLIGGTIQKVDRIRDQLTIQVFGGGKMKVAFDPRTHIYQGSTQASASDLRPGDRVYVDTILDRSIIFARNIRLAKAAAGGMSQGVVMSYRADKNELIVRDLLSPDPVKLRFTPNTQIVQDGRAAFASQLVPGTLVDVSFAAQRNDRNAQRVSILAVPGTDFTFAGQVTALDLRIGLLVLTSVTDHKTYEIYLDPSVITFDERLHPGAEVTSVANFDGSRYVARTLTVNSQ